MAFDAENRSAAEVLAAEFKSTYAALDRKTEDQAQVIDALRKAVESKSNTADLEDRLAGLTAEVQKAVEAADAIDKKMARPNGGDFEAKSVGRQFSGNERAQAFMSERRGSSGKIEVKAITLANSAVSDHTVQALGQASRAGIVGLPQRTMTVRSLLSQGRTGANAVEYPKVLTWVNNAAGVAELALKPESNMTFGLETAPVRTIAHWIAASKQVMDDTPMLESLIDTQLLYGLAFEEDRQLLLGDGSGQNIHGILPQATAFVATGIPAGATSFVDRLRWAKLQARKALLPADGIVLNPEDWAKIEMLKDAEGRYLYSAFTSGAEQRLWGMRVVESDAITAGQFLIGSFTSGAQIWDREDASVEVSYENSDNFVRNALTIRAEERLALTVYRPNAFVTGALAAA